MSDSKRNVGAKKTFTKEEMLNQVLASGTLDSGTSPIIRRFLSLPLTSTCSCYGHEENGREPFLSYVNDEPKNQKDGNFQKEFRRRLSKLNQRINLRIGGSVVRIFLDKSDYEGGPYEYVLKFNIVDKELLQKLGKKLLDIIWEEFANYLDELAKSYL